jgi:uncharacterized protein (DUF1800 family)
MRQAQDGRMTPIVDQTWLDAARLARRTGFGATGAEVDAVVAAGRPGYLAAALAADPAADAGVVGLATPDVTFVSRVGKDADPAAKRAEITAARAELVKLSGWWLRRMAMASSPFAEKITLVWHNHFATSATKVRSAALMLGQNQTLRQQGRGSFRTLALAMLTDPAMLYWLDGQKNVTGAPNENLSREFMELFTLGHGNGYSEQDVKDGARALTGWTINRAGQAQLLPAKHDSATKTVLGVTGNLDQTGYCDAILAQPAAAEHVVARTFGQLGSEEPLSAATLAALAAKFGTSWDISEMLTGLLLSDDFVAARGRSVINPVEWLVGAVRALRVPLDDDATVQRLGVVLQSLGQTPLYPPSVGGWPAGPAWLSTAAADVRFATAAALVKKADLDTISAAAPAARVDAVGYLLGVGAWSGRSRATLQDSVSDPARLVAVALNTSEYLTQ